MSSKQSESGSCGCGSSLIHDSRLELLHIKKALRSALHASVPSSLVKTSSCSQPQKALAPMYRSLGGMTISLSEVQQRKASFPIFWSFGGSHTSVRATQYEKVEPLMAIISAHMRFTSTRFFTPVALEG